jgi:hypothetical protein
VTLRVYCVCLNVPTCMSDRSDPISHTHMKGTTLLGISDRENSEHAGADSEKIKRDRGTSNGLLES